MTMTWAHLIALDTDLSAVELVKIDAAMEAGESCPIGQAVVLPRVRRGRSYYHSSPFAAAAVMESISDGGEVVASGIVGREHFEDRIVAYHSEPTPHFDPGRRW